jgi:DUF4097 and DUF4098 domain-containing protein YvlB
MKRSVLVLIAILAAAAPPAAAQGAQDDPVVRRIVRERVAASVSAATERVERYRGQNRSEETESFTRTLKIGANGTIDISNIAGDIRITRGNGDVVVEVLKQARGRTPEDAKEMLQLVRVDIAERAGRAEIRTRYPEGDETRRNNRRNINVSVQFTISAPAGTRIIAKSISGGISTKDITGDVTLESISGAVSIHNGGRVANAKSISGQVEVVDTEIEGALEASSVSGSVVLRNVKAGRLNGGSVSGNVMIQNVDCDRIEATSVSGDIQFSGALARGGRYELSSHSGEVRLTLGSDTGFELEATSFSGSVRSDFPVTIPGGDGNRSRRQRSLRGVYGDGSAVLDLSTFSGSIVITKR